TTSRKVRHLPVPVSHGCNQVPSHSVRTTTKSQISYHPTVEVLSSNFFTQPGYCVHDQALWTKAHFARDIRRRNAVGDQGIPESSTGQHDAVLTSGRLEAGLQIREQSPRTFRMRLQMGSRDVPYRSVALKRLA